MFPPNWTYLFDMVGNEQVYKDFNQMYMFSSYEVMLKDSTEGAGHGAVLKEAFNRIVLAQTRMV